MTTAAPPILRLEDLEEPEAAPVEAPVPPEPAEPPVLTLESLEATSATEAAESLPQPPAQTGTITTPPQPSLFQRATQAVRAFATEQTSPQMQAQVAQRNERWAILNFFSSASNTLAQMGLGLGGVIAKLNEAVGFNVPAAVTGQAALMIPPILPEDVADMQEDVQQYYQPRGGAAGFAGEAWGTVISLIPAIATGGTSILTKAIPILFGLSEAGGTFADVAKAKAEGRTISPTEEYATSLANGVIEWGFETLGMRWIQRGITAMGGKVGLIKSAKEAAKGGTREALKWVLSRAVVLLGNAGQQAGEEAGTALLQGIATRIGLRKGEEFGQAEPDWGALPGEVGRGAGLGALATGGMIPIGLMAQAAQPSTPPITPEAPAPVPEAGPPAAPAEAPILTLEALEAEEAPRAEEITREVEAPSEEERVREEADREVRLRDIEEGRAAPAPEAAEVVAKQPREMSPEELRVALKGGIDTYHSGALPEQIEGRGDFGGLHVGTEQAAIDRGKLPSELGRDTWQGRKVQKVRVVAENPYMPEGRILDEGDPLDRTALFTIQRLKGEQDALLRQGYDVVPYRNDIEDPGSISYIILDPKGYSLQGDQFVPPKPAAVEPEVPEVAKPAPEEAKPRKVFRGDIEVGRPPVARVPTPPDLEGIYFAEDRGMAESFAAMGREPGEAPGPVTEYEVNLRNPATSEIENQVLRELGAKEAEDGMLLYDHNLASQVAEELQERGYDGVVRTTGEVIAFSPKAVKPAPTKPAAVEPTAVARGAPPAEVGVAPAEKAPPGVPTTTSIKLESVGEARAERGLAPVDPTAPQTKESWIKQAREQVDKDPALPTRLVQEMIDRPRSLNPVEVGVLQVHRRTVTTAYADATKKFFDAVEAKDETAKESARRAVEVYDLELQAMEEASRSAGAAWARSGIARQLELKQDYSLAAMIRRARVANEGKSLTDKQMKRIKSQADKIAAIQKKIDAQDFAKKPKRKLSKKELKLQLELEQVKAEYQKGVFLLKLRNRTIPRKIIGAGGEIFNVARAIMTSFDVSAVMRQGGFIALAHPIRAARAIPSMLRALVSEKQRFAIEQEIANRPNATLYKSAGLYLSRRGGALSQMEEVYMSRWAEKIPGVAASERAFTTFLDRLRADSFDAMVKSLGRNGEVTQIEAQAIANFINVATGRGSLGMRESAQTALSTIFFAPRLVASRFQILAAQPLYGGTARTRAMIAMEYARFLAGLGVIFGLVALTPDEWEWETELDPRSSDFGKIKVGKTRVDMLTGLSQTAVFVSRLAVGERITQRGKVVPIRGKDVPYGSGTAAEVTARFLRSKLSPVSGTFVNVVSGQDFIGRPVTVGTTVENLATPMAIRDIYEAMRAEGVPHATAIGLLAMFGVSVQTYQPRKKKTGRRVSRRRGSR